MNYMYLHAVIDNYFPASIYLTNHTVYHVHCTGMLRKYSFDVIGTEARRTIQTG